MEGPGFFSTFLFYFVGATLIAAFVLSQGADLGSVNPLQPGILFGLLAGLVGAYFNHHETATIAMTNRGAFIQKLKTTLTEINYEETGRVEEFTVYQRSIPSRFLSGKLFVQLEKNHALFSGRSSLIKLLKQRLEEE
jgi:hypothetical protein